jgi:hypothetical protein
LIIASDVFSVNLDIAKRHGKGFRDINIRMQKMRYATKSPTRGGARAGAGRPRGSGNKVVASDVLAEILRQSGGQDYTELLVEDFLRSRAQDDKNLAQKYHHLISSKVLADRIDIEVNEDEDTVTAKRTAFAAALAAVAGITPQVNKTS